MHQPVDGRHRGHRILEDLIPLAENQIGTDEQPPPFVALGERGSLHGLDFADGGDLRAFGGSIHPNE
jgi:hypothetical protein